MYFFTYTIGSFTTHQCDSAWEVVAACLCDITRRCCDRLWPVIISFLPLTVGGDVDSVPQVLGRADPSDVVTAGAVVLYVHGFGATQGLMVVCFVFGNAGRRVRA